MSARLAILHAKGELRLKEAIVVESILGAEAHFVGRVVRTGMVGPFASVTPEISGRAFVTGMHQFVADPRDNLAGAFSFEPTQTRPYHERRIRVGICIVQI